MVQLQILRISRRFFRKYQKVFLPPKISFSGGYFPLRERIAIMHIKITYDLSIAIINEYFEFQSDCLKIIHIRYNCTQFCPIPLC